VGPAGDGTDPNGRPLRLPNLLFGAPLLAPRKVARKLMKAGLDPIEVLKRKRVGVFRPAGEYHNHPEAPLLEVPAQLRYRDGSELARMAQVPKRIKRLVYDYFGFTLQPFHDDILRLMFEGGFLDVMLPTEHGKSTIANVVFPVLSMMADPDGAHILCCTNLDDAKSWLARIKDKLESRNDPRTAALLRDYPWLEKPEGGNKRWGATEITIAGRSDVNNRNPSVLAIGRGADSIRQRRGKFIGDDLEGKGAVREKAREELWSWIRLEAMRTIEDVAVQPRRLFLNVGTPFDPDSIHIRLAELKYKNGNAVFRVYRQPYKYDSGRLIWGQKRQKIEELRGLWDDEVWAIAMELNPKGLNPFAMGFREVQQQTGIPKPELAASTWTFVSLDPASGSTHSRADYCGVAVERVKWEPDWMLPVCEVVEAYKYSDEAIAQVTFCLELAEKHRCPIVVEKNAMQKIYKGLFRHLARQLRAGGQLHWFDPEQHVYEHYTSQGNKADPRVGVSIIKTLARVGRLKIVDSEGGRTLQREIANLGTGGHDHIAMATWFPIRYVYDHRRLAQRRSQVVMPESRLPVPYRPLVGQRTLRLRRSFQDRSFIHAAPGEPVDEFDRPMLRDTNPG
jgi:hypothetical protein